MVKRYTPHVEVYNYGYSLIVDVSNNGDYVKCDNYAALKSELDALREKVRWRDVREELPKHGNVLCMFNDGEVAVGWPVYWHGAREGEFAQFMFPLDDLDDGRPVIRWAMLPTVQTSQSNKD